MMVTLFFGGGCEIGSNSDNQVTMMQVCSNLDNSGADIHIFGFCTINFFWNQLFLWCVNTNIWISAPPAPPPIIELAMALWWVDTSNHNGDKA